MQKVCVINGHVKEGSMGEQLAKEYINILKENNIDVELIDLANLDFNPVLTDGYETELEKSILKSQEIIKNSNLLVFMYPIYWYGAPAIVKGFLDKIFWKDVAFNFREKKYFFKGLLRGKKSRVIYTLGGDKNSIKLLSQNAPIKVMKAMLRVSGIFSNKFTALENLDNSKRKSYEEYSDIVKSVALKDMKRIV